MFYDKFFTVRQQIKHKGNTRYHEVRKAFGLSVFILSQFNYLFFLIPLFTLISTTFVETIPKLKYAFAKCFSEKNSKYLQRVPPYIVAVGSINYGRKPWRIM